MPDPIDCGGGVVVPAEAIRVTASRASGPGGQNVNKVSSKVEVRVDPERIAGLDEAARGRLRALAGRRVDAEGLLRVVSQASRDQPANLARAYEAIRGLVKAALVRPKPRRPTRPSRAGTERRLEQKRRTSTTKRARGRSPADE